MRTDEIHRAPQIITRHKTNCVSEYVKQCKLKKLLSKELKELPADVLAYLTKENVYTIFDTLLDATTKDIAHLWDVFNKTNSIIHLFHIEGPRTGTFTFKHNKKYEKSKKQAINRTKR